MTDASGAALTAVGERIDNLETRIAFQDDVIERLNKIVVEQWAKLDQMQGQITRLEAQLRDVQANVGSDGHEEPPPPHY